MYTEIGLYLGIPISSERKASYPRTQNKEMSSSIFFSPLVPINVLERLSKTKVWGILTIRVQDLEPYTPLCHNLGKKRVCLRGRRSERCKDVARPPRRGRSRSCLRKKISVSRRRVPFRSSIAFVFLSLAGGDT